MEEGCIIAHYKHKSEEEMTARQKSYQAGAFMRDKLNASSDQHHREQGHASIRRPCAPKNEDTFKAADPPPRLLRAGVHL